MVDQLSGRRVLVVEDEVMVAWMLEDMLGQLGCAVIGPAARVDKALALIDSEDVDAAVLDINLNGEKCYPIADALMARGVPFVFSTGYGAGGIEAPWRDRPVLQKPFSQADLEQAIDSTAVRKPS